MHPALACARALPRRAQPVDTSTPPPLSLVTIDVTLPGTSSAAPRRALRAALGEGSRLFVMAVDRHNVCITFRVEVTARSVGDVVGALAGALRRATIGRVRAVGLAQSIAHQH